MARRYFVRPLPESGTTTLLSPRHGHFLGRVVRIRAGQGAVLFDGLGREANATVVEVCGREVLVDVHGALDEPRGRSPRMALEIACALPKSPRTDWLFEHGTEAGVGSFRPILTERTNRRIHERHQRWEKVLIAASAQCDRLHLPTIEPTLTLDQLCARELPAERYVATQAPKELGPARSSTAILVIGPEGGWAPSELDRLDCAGFAARNLGPLTLRTETAVLAGATRLLQCP